MFWIKNVTTSQPAEVQTALEFATKVAKGIERKSDKNKNLTDLLIFTVLASTVFSPLLIFAPFEEPWSKLLPAGLSALAALSTGWLQVRRPQERWAMYRTAQREIEFEIAQFVYGNGEYSDPANKDQILADKVSKRALRLNYEWLPVVPKTDDLRKVNEEFYEPRKLPTQN